jgi:hypothetical protein
MKLPPMRRAADSVEEIADSELVPTAPDSSADVTTERRPVEELSASILLTDPSSSANTALPSVLVAPGPVVLPPVGPPPRPEPAPERAEATGRRSRIAAAQRLALEFRLLLEKPEHKWTVAALAFCGVLFMVSVTAIIVGLSKGGSGKPTPAASSEPAGSAAPPSSTPWAPVESAHGGVAQPHGPASRTACGISGGPHVIAPKAVVVSGVEAVAADGKIALGFAVAAKDGLAVEVDPPSLSVSATAKAHAHETIRRLVPLVGDGPLGVAADVDHGGGRLRSAHTIGGEQPFMVGTVDGQLAWAAHATDEPVSLWPLLSDSPVEALRGVSLGDKGYALVFRQDGAIWLGALTAGKTPNGLLSKVAGLGVAVGSPTLAVTGDVALVAWADRRETTDPWGVRWLTWTPGNPPNPPQEFAIPAGGLGEQAMSPAVTGMSGERFLMVWTEGPVSSHQVRALTLSSDGAPLGPPLTISAEGVNAGQGQVAVTAEGHGVVAFLASNGAGFEVVANPVECPLSAL